MKHIDQEDLAAGGFTSQKTLHDQQPTTMRSHSALSGISSVKMELQQKMAGTLVDQKTLYYQEPKFVMM